MVDGEILVEVRGVSKKFSRNFKSSLSYGLKDITRAIFLPAKERTTTRSDEFWAVKDVSFELRRGECFGLIGHNGAGKSTLLKILNGLIRPDTGEIIMRGRVGALIELGAGFNPVLSGRENVYINGQILGFSKKEVDDKLDAIVEFSEIGEFIDAPVQNYSSGMKVRLGFAIAAQMEPDILIIDEVLAVGDLGFRLKCLNRISELINKTCVILVSHTMPQISRVCNKACLMEHGEVAVLSDQVAEVIDAYFTRFHNNDSKGLVFNNGQFRLNQIMVSSPNHAAQIFTQGAQVEITRNAFLKIVFDFELDEVVNLYSVKINIINKETKPIIDIPSGIVTESFTNFIRNRIEITISEVPLNQGEYLIALILLNEGTGERILRIDSFLNLRVRSNYVSWTDVVLDCEWKATNMILVEND